MLADGYIVCKPLRYDLKSCDAMHGGLAAAIFLKAPYLLTMISALIFYSLSVSQTRCSQTSVFVTCHGVFNVHRCFTKV